VDGFHDIERGVVAVDLYDRLEPELGPGLTLECRGEPAPAGGDNLVLRAAEALRDATDCTLGADITLHKSIPVGRGLGGGSSDAASALVLLNELWQTGLCRAELADIGAGIGSDVPLFLASVPASIIRGRGERVEPLRCGCGWHFVIVAPRWGLATERVCGGVRLPVTRCDDDVNMIVGLFPDGPVELLSKYLFNALSESACREQPELRRVLDELRQFGASAVSITGSGSAVFAVASSADEARDWAENARMCGMGQVFVVKGLR
ncbi:MAG: 4-(cytidine 5'-diphospho)-2-C-methyl-D-erythritol kinase, partial [Planctomycetia bacterium]|nr:4-(cytidine 5'-diphospho)-2-C-methyl-D-erythritol kinase [Planctomycetia bacterium]